MKKTNSLILTLMFLPFLASCSHEIGVLPSSDPTPSVTVSFQNDVRPLFNRYGCTSCHGGTNNLFVTSVANLLRGGLHGPAIVPLKPDDSILVQKIKPNPPFDTRMPQGGPYMRDDEIQIIVDWIKEGAMDN
jgi:hypothetical protein